MTRSNFWFRWIATECGDPASPREYSKPHHWPYPQRISPSALETPEKKKLFLAVSSSPPCPGCARLPARVIA